MADQAFSFDCGANALYAVFAYYGIKTRETELIKLAGTTKRGTSIKGIIKAAKKCGLKCKAGEMNLEEIKKYINKKIPVIIALQAWTLAKNIDWENDWFDGHYVVAIGYDKKRIYFEDPFLTSRDYLEFDEFSKRWHDMGKKRKKYVNYGIALYGKKAKFSSKKFKHMD
jgi:ATP-binding cassette subfamily B protein